MSEGKKNIIAGMLQEYDTKSAEVIQDALKDLLCGTIQSMLEVEMDDYLGYAPYGCAANTNSRNDLTPLTNQENISTPLHKKNNNLDKKKSRFKRR
jgi:hypothetical protein